MLLNFVRLQSSARNGLGQSMAAHCDAVSVIEPPDGVVPMRFAA